MSTRMQRAPILAVRRAWVLAICIIILHRLLMIMTESDQALRGGISESFTVIVNLGIVMGMFYVARHATEDGRQVRIAWMLMGIGMASATLAAICFAILDAQGLAQIPSIADGFYLAFYPIFGVGLILMPGSTISTEERTKVLLDTSIVMIAAFLVFWIALIAPILELEQAEEPLTILIAIAYPVFDWAMIFAILRLLFSRSSTVRPLPLLLIALAATGQVVFDVVAFPQLLANT